jgi:UDPglucose 6-dehydrogenase
VAEAATAANEGPVVHLLQHMEKDLGGLDGKVIAVWGLAFKPRTDDVREAPAIKLIGKLLEKGATVRATDPQAMETAAASLEFRGIQRGVVLCKEEYETCEGADALVLATEWNEYRSPDFERIQELMRGRHVFDGRNILVPEAVADAGLRYRGMGRPVVGD